MSKKYFVTFANKNYMSTDRIMEQAKEFNVFDGFYRLNELDIKNFITKHENFINSNPVGFGLWIWKPKIIYDTLLEINDNDLMVYCDAGFYLNIKGKKRLEEYFSKLQNDKCILTFSTSKSYRTREFVKVDAIMNYYPEMINKLDISNYAGLMIIKKNDYSLQVIKEWLDLCENYNFINRSRSIKYKELPCFQGNDCDNGLFNMCISKHENIVEKIFPDETNLYIDEKQIVHCTNYKEIKNDVDWSSLENFPFQCRRMTPKFGY